MGLGAFGIRHGILDYKIENVVEEPTLLLEFTTNDVGAGTFDPVFNVDFGILNWDLGDGSIVNDNVISHDYANPGNKTVKVNKGTTSGAGAITTIDMYDDKLVGTLDISSLINLNFIEAGNNINLTEIKNPISSTIFTGYRVDYAGITGILDLSGLSGLGGTIDVWGNAAMTEIKNPTSSQTIISYSAQQCGLIGTFDASGLTGLSVHFDLLSCPSLNKVIMPNVSSMFNYFVIAYCDLTGTLDVSALTGLSDVFSVSNNANLTDILLPTFADAVSFFEARNCSLNTTTVNDIFAKFNTYYTANPPDVSSWIWVDGGTNASPAGGYSNGDIVNLYSIFTGLGLDVSILIN